MLTLVPLERVAAIPKGLFLETCARRPRADLADIFLCRFGGKKRVLLFTPDQTPHLYRVPFSFSTLSDVRPDAPDYERFPALGQAPGTIAELGHGDALYIPAGGSGSV